MKLLYATIAFFLCLHTPGVHAQFYDSLKLTIGSTATIASQDYQPLWLVSNRYGVITDQAMDISSHLRFSNQHILGSSKQLYQYLREYKNIPEVGISYGADIYVNQLFSALFIQEGFVRVHVNQWQLSAGRFEEVIGEVNPELSSGSLGVSGNALPIPKVSLAVKEYTDIPFTQGFLQFKGLISHGWMRNRFIENALLHEKNLYLRAGSRQFGVYGGFNHFVVWGGKHLAFGQLPNSMNDFWKYVFGQVADMENPLAAETERRAGSHLGIVDLGVDASIKDVNIRLYKQVPFETKKGILPFGSPNKMLGLSLTRKSKDKIISAATLEYIHTRHQPVQNSIAHFANYYNNAIYPTGWSYLGNIIGTPLFFDQQRGEHYFTHNVSTVQWNIVNNRIRGFHLGIRGQLPYHLQYRTLLTFTENYGNSFNSAQFYPRKLQWYLMQEILYQYQAWQFNATLGVDAGELTQNTGLMLGVAYDLGQLIRAGRINSKLWY